MVNEIYLGGLEHEWIMTFHMLGNRFWDTPLQAGGTQVAASKGLDSLDSI